MSRLDDRLRWRRASRPILAGARARFSPHFIVMGLVFAGAILIAYLLLPDDNERIASLERDGHDQQALELLEQRFANGDRGARTLFQLQAIYEEQGNLPKARQMLEMLAGLRPRDANVQRHLAEFYRSTQDEEAYIRALQARLAIRFSQPVCRELIGIFRRAGRFNEEQTTLADCHAKGYGRSDDVIRLANLTAADGRLAEAAGLLRSVDDRRRLREDRDRLMLFAALTEAGAADEAKRRATRWFKGSHDEGLVLQIIDLLATGNRHDLAIDLAREVGKPGDSISLAVAELMLDRDQVVAARTYLRGWLEAAHLVDPELAERMIRAALDAEDPMLAYRAAELFGLKQIAQQDLVALAEALSAIDQKAAFQAVRDLIEPGNIKENLLLAAAVEVEKGQPEPARQLLSRIQVKALDEWRLALWARLMASTGRRATAQQTLQEISDQVRSSGGPALNMPLPSVAPEPVPRPGTAPAARSTGAAPPPTAKPETPQPPRLIRRNRTPTSQRPPRRSRSRNAPNPPPAKSAPLPSPAPFPWNG